MVFHLDTSAAAKLVVAELASQAMASWAAANENRVIASDLLRTELLRATVTPQIGQHWSLPTNVGHLDHAGLVACARPVAAATAPPHGTTLPVTQGTLVPQSGQVASRDQGNPLSSWRLSRHEAEHQTGCLVAEPSAVVGTARLAPRWSASWATPSPRASAPVVPRTCAQYLAPGRAHEPRMV
jgi:hypothetical protein